MAKGQWVIQVMETGETKEQAQEFLSGLRLQSDFLGGRVARNASGEWFSQTLHDDATCAGMSDGWLPDGCRRVFLLDSMSHLFQGG